MQSCMKSSLMYVINDARTTLGGTPLLVLAQHAFSTAVHLSGTLLPQADNDIRLCQSLHTFK